MECIKCSQSVALDATGVDNTILLHVVKQSKFSMVSNHILCSLRLHENGKRGFADIRNGENEINSAGDDFLDRSTVGNQMNCLSRCGCWDLLGWPKGRRSEAATQYDFVPSASLAVTLLHA